MFIHGGWLHLGSNMLYLWIFGDNVEDRLGHLMYPIFYLACGATAALAQVAVGPTSMVPMVGASGAIAGVMGAYLFLYPRARVTILLILGFFVRPVSVPAYFLIGSWAVLQILIGMGSLSVETQSTGGVAYWAHIGGFFAGVVLITLITAVFRLGKGRPPTTQAGQVEPRPPQVRSSH